MSIIRLVLALLIVNLSVATLHAAETSGAAAEAERDVLLNAIRANRKAVVAASLTLTDAEAAKFWPVYDRYQQEINAIGDRVVKVIEEYTANFATLQDDQAKKLIQEYLDAEADRAKVKRTYLDELAQVLPGRKLARFYQIENKMDAVLRYDLAATIPVVDEQQAAETK